MRLERRWHTTLPRQFPEPTLGELSLFHHDSKRTTDVNPDDRSTSDIYHLRYTDTQVISPPTTPALVGVNLVRQSGAPAFA